MTRRAHDPQGLEIVGFDGVPIVECERVLPIARIKGTDRHFRLSNRDGSVVPREFYTGEEIASLAEQRRLTCFPTPLPAPLHAIAVYVTRTLLTTGAFDLTAPDWGYGLTWQNISSNVQATCGPRNVIDEMMNAWGSRLLEELNRRLISFFAMADKRDAILREIVDVAEMALCSISDVSLRTHVYLRYGLALKSSTRPERVENLFEMFVRLEFPTWDEETFTTQLWRLADHLRFQAARLTLVSPAGSAGRVLSAGEAPSLTTPSLEKSSPAGEALFLPIDFVPTPTQQYQRHQRLSRGEPAPSPVPVPPAPPGARALIWKRDPSTGDTRIVKTYLAGDLLPGPHDARIAIQGLPVVRPNALGDLIAPPGTDAFDAIHTFAVVRETLALYRRLLLPSPLPWQWNVATNTDPLEIFPHDSLMMNASYSRADRAIRFGFFQRLGPPPNPLIFTCRSLDTVAHTTGHAILDALKPGWLYADNPPQTAALHESFADLTTLFLFLDRMEEVQELIVHTRANLHDKTALIELGEQLGMILGRPNALCNAANDLKLSQVGNDIHPMSQVFSGGVYDVLADVFALERNPTKTSDVLTLYEAGTYLRGLVLRAIIQAPNTGATYRDVANKMRSLAVSDGKPQVSAFIRNCFILREVLAPGTPLAEEEDLPAGVTDEIGAVQDRRNCCGTMQQREYQKSSAHPVAPLQVPQRSQQRRSSS